MTAVASATGANRIYPAASIVYPLGNPALQGAQEAQFRLELTRNALRLLCE